MSDNTATVSANPRDQDTNQNHTSPTKNQSGASDQHSSNSHNNEAQRSSKIANQQQQRGRALGNYILGHTLGKGAFGKVKTAIHTLTGEKVAVKILEKDRIVDVSDVERVAREIHILKLIRHPNIIQLYEIIETPKELFLIMEFASGGELFEYIVANTRVQELEASRFFHEIISCVEYIHKLNIVHRDLKPENILLDANKSVKMVDFGLSNTYKNNQLLKTACGSPCYAAPEMIAGKKYHGLTVDIWSCGVILFALICGYLPFEDPNTSNLYNKILNGDYSVPKFVSNEGKDLIRNILNTDPAKRFTIEDIRRHPWMNMIKMPREPQGIIIGYHQVPIDRNILKQLENYKIDLEYAQKCLEANKHNHVTTTYYLLLKKFTQSGGKSPADINSAAFDKSLLIPKINKPKTNNFLDVSTVSNDVSKEKEKEKSAEGERNREKSIEKNARTFILNYINTNPTKPRDKIRISGSIENSSRDGDLSVMNCSSNGSRETSKENSRHSQPPEPKERLQDPRSVFPVMKHISSRETKRGMGLNNSASKDFVSPVQKIQIRSQRRSKILNTSINNDVLKEKLNMLDGNSRNKATRATHLINETFTSPKHLFKTRKSKTGTMPPTSDLLSESIRFDEKNNITLINASSIIQNIAGSHLEDPNNTFSDYNTKRMDTSFRSSPKERKAFEPYPPKDPTRNNFDAFGREIKVNSTKGTNPGPIIPVQPRQQPQTPSRNYGVMPREPVIVKQENSFMNTHRTKFQIGRVGRVRVASNEPKNNTKGIAIQSREKDSGRMGSMIDDKRKVVYYNDSSQGSSANTSFILNGSFQQSYQNNSFDYYPPTRPSLNSSVNKGYQGVDIRSKRAKQSIVSPVNIYNTNLFNIINKR